MLSVENPSAMSSFGPPPQSEGAVVPAATGTASGENSEKPSMPWPAVVAIFKTTRILKPTGPIIPSAPLIAANTTLGQDKAAVLRCWLSMGGKEDTLRRMFMVEWEWRRGTSKVKTCRSGMG